MKNTTQRMTFDDVEPGSIVDFREYSLGTDNKRHLSVEVSNARVIAVLPGSQRIGIVDLKKYYGDTLDNMDYLQLAISPHTRMVLDVGKGDNNSINIKIVTMVPDFLATGMQEIDIRPGIIQNSTPGNYLKDGINYGNLLSPH